jgi:predicted transcriptional regulator with HTH domain
MRKNISSSRHRMDHTQDIRVLPLIKSDLEVRIKIIFIIYDIYCILLYSELKVRALRSSPGRIRRKHKQSPSQSDEK